MPCSNVLCVIVRLAYLSSKMECVWKVRAGVLEPGGAGTGRNWSWEELELGEGGEDVGGGGVCSVGGKGLMFVARSK